MNTVPTGSGSDSSTLVVGPVGLIEFRSGSRSDTGNVADPDPFG